MKQQVVFFIFLFILLFVLFTVYTFSNPEPSLPEKELIEKEVMRLQQLQSELNLTKVDLVLLGKLVKGNDKLNDGYVEVLWLFGHNYSSHVSHSLNALYWLAKDGKVVCPSDSLSHVALYMKFGEIELAKQATEEGRESLAEWSSKVNSAKSVNPAFYPNSEELILTMNKVLSSMDAGNYVLAANASAHLGEIGYC